MKYNLECVKYSINDVVRQRQSPLGVINSSIMDYVWEYIKENVCDPVMSSARDYINEI